jgi:chloramphenicol 3-O phosphotransferase
MEPHPPDRGPGRIIVLNGASSSGKSMLAKAMQEALPEPFLHVSPDHLVASGMLPARRDPDGPFAWWQQMRPRFFDGFHRCLPALAAAGNDLIVEYTIEFRAWREYLATLLDGLDVFLADVHRDLAEIDRRERDRGDRRIGEGRSHVETDLIHSSGPTTSRSTRRTRSPARLPHLYWPPGEPAPAGELCGRAYLATGEPYPEPVATGTRRGMSAHSPCGILCIDIQTGRCMLSRPRPCWSAGMAGASV